MDKISIIIPVYNVEPYIRKCLDSVLNQTHSNFEVLLINDGSTDDSGNICDEYAGKDKRIRVFHKENGGLSTALNVGLGCFTGAYLGFVDSDDWIEPDMYEVLYKAVKESSVEISVVGYYKDTETEATPMVNKIPIPEGIIGTRDMILFPLKRDYYMGFGSYVWNKLYSVEIIKSCGIIFDDEIRYGMDVLFYMSLVSSKKCTGVYINKPLYHYMQRNTAISKIRSIAIKTDILTAYKGAESTLITNGYSDIVYWVRGFYCYHASVVAEIAFTNNDKKTLRLMQGEIKKHLDDYIETNREFPEKIERMQRLLDLEIALGQEKG